MPKQKIIILVGPDMCGKSNIATELSNRLTIPIYKSSSEHYNFLSAQNRFINDIRHACPARLDLVKQANLSVIFDRAYPCEYVYSKYYDRQTDIDAIKFLDEEYAKLGAYIVLCTRESFKGIQDDLNPKLDEAALTAISSLYDDFATWTKCKLLKLYVDDYDLARQTSDILNFIKEI